MKDTETPFLIKIIEENDNVYKENELYLYFKGQEKRYRPIRIERQKFKSCEDFKTEQELLNFFRFKSGTNERHNELLKKIGMMRILNFSQFDRERIITFMNSRFPIPLPDGEVKLILKTTVNGRKGR